MIYNATLLRVDPPGEGQAGAAAQIRVALTPLTTEQGRISREMDWGAELVAYIPFARVTVPPPAVDGRVLIRTDGVELATTCVIVHIIERLGRTLSHVQLYLAPTA